MMYNKLKMVIVQYFIKYSVHLFTL